MCKLVELAAVVKACLAAQVTVVLIEMISSAFGAASLCSVNTVLGDA